MSASTTNSARIRVWAVRLFRAGLLIAVFLVLRFQGERAPSAGITLDDVRHYFPESLALREGDNLTTVLGEEDATLGFVVKTLPISGNVVGYAGPSDVLIAFDADGHVIGARLLWSGDTPEHTEAVHQSPTFFEAFRGWTFSGDNDASAIDAVSGATLTSLAIVESVAVRLGGELPSLKFPDPITLNDVQRIFPEAAALDTSTSDSRRLIVTDASGARLGDVLRTSPVSDAITGYQGPSEVLIGLQPNGRVQGITLGKTYDNQRYADYVREDRRFTREHRDATLKELAQLDVDQVWADGVSGATMTSGAVMEAAIHYARTTLEPTRQTSADARSFQLRLRDGITLLAIGLACLFAFTRLRANRKAKWVLQLYLVLVLGLWAGDMVSLAVLGGWAEGAVPLRSAPGLVALVAAAFVLPWSTGKPVYCQHLCPHGAAQELIYRIVPGRARLPRWLHRVLSALPYLVLAAGVMIATVGLPLSLSAIEPFDAWIFGIGGVATVVIALIGLAASAFVPQAYCKYGCPTGLILDYARTRRREVSLSGRDALATGLIALALVLSSIF